MTVMGLAITVMTIHIPDNLQRNDNNSTGDNNSNNDSKSNDGNHKNQNGSRDFEIKIHFISDIIDLKSRIGEEAGKIMGDK